MSFGEALAVADTASGTLADWSRGNRRMRWSRDGAKEASGVVTAEFTLLIPIFILLVFGMVWTGTTLFRYLNLELAARDGARFAATLPSGFPADSSGDVASGIPTDDWFIAVADGVQARSVAATRICVAYRGLPANEQFDEGGSAISRVYVRSADGTVVGPENGSCFDDGRAISSRRVQVQTDGPVPLRIFDLYDGNLRGDATARFEAVYPNE
jgi:hypothetical protein